MFGGRGVGERRRGYLPFAEVWAALGYYLKDAGGTLTVFARGKPPNRAIED